MWTLISGLIVLGIMIVASCLSYATAILRHKQERQEEMARMAEEDTPEMVLVNSYPDSRAHITILFSPMDLDTISRQLKQNPPAYEDLPPPPYEIAVMHI